MSMKISWARLGSCDSSNNIPHHHHATKQNKTQQILITKNKFGQDRFWKQQHSAFILMLHHQNTKSSLIQEHGVGIMDLEQY